MKNLQDDLFALFSLLLSEDKLISQWLMVIKLVNSSAVTHFKIF